MMITQENSDIGEIVDAYYHGGAILASKVFQAVAHARSLSNSQIAEMGHNIRQELLALGFIPIK